MIIIYAYDTNEILAEPIKTRSDADMFLAYDVLYDTLEKSEQAPKLNMMDNEESTALNRLFQKYNSVTISATI